MEYRINITEVITGRVLVRVSTTTSLEIASLHPDYVYQWVVTAVTTGTGPYTSASTIRTPEDSECYRKETVLLNKAHPKFSFVILINLSAKQ